MYTILHFVESVVSPGLPASSVGIYGCASYYFANLKSHYSIIVSTTELCTLSKFLYAARRH